VIDWIDAYLIPLLIAVPALGGFFLAIMPSSDRIALRHAGMGASIALGLVALRAAWRVVVEGLDVVFRVTPPGMTEPLELQVTGVAAPTLVTIAFLFPMALRAGAPRIVDRTQGYVVLMLTAELLSILALLVADPIWRVAFLSFATIPVLFLTALFGGAQRGTVTMRVAMAMITVDTLALTALTYANVAGRGAELAPETQAWLLLPVLAAGGMRLGLIPLTAPFLSCLRQAPVAGAALVVGVWMPMGGFVIVCSGWSFLTAGAALLAPWVAGVALASAILGALMAASDRDLRRVVGAFAIAHGGVATLGLIAGDAEALAAALIYLPVTGVSLAFLLFTVDALERRYLSRDLTELVGVSHHLPALWRVLVAALGACLGVPLLGAGSLIVPLGEGALRGFSAQNADLAWFLFLGVAVVLTALVAGAIVILRHVSAAPVVGDELPPSRLTAGQAARLWFPGVLLLVAAALALPAHTRLAPHAAQWIATQEAE
jgi:NADH-quinone oxidoreductase subunit M